MPREMMALGQVEIGYDPNKIHDLEPRRTALRSQINEYRREGHAISVL